MQRIMARCAEGSTSISGEAYFQKGVMLDKQGSGLAAVVSNQLFNLPFPLKQSSEETTQVGTRIKTEPLCLEKKLCLPKININRVLKETFMIIAFDEKPNASLISFLRPVSFELVCLCTAMQNFSRLL